LLHESFPLTCLITTTSYNHERIHSISLWQIASSPDHNLVRYGRNNQSLCSRLREQTQLPNFKKSANLCTLLFLACGKMYFLLLDMQRPHLQVKGCIISGNISQTDEIS